MKFEDEDFLTAEEREAIAAGPRTFAPEQMVACDGCRRLSPPTRMSCLYCGAPLAVADGAEDLRRPSLRPLEDWERGLVVALLPPESKDDDGARRESDDEAAAVLDGEALAGAAALVRLAPGELREMLSARVPLPVARTGEREEAALLERKLDALGLRVVVVADEELSAAESPPLRVRQLRLGESEISGRTAGGEELCAEWAAVELIVAGRVHERRIETAERRGRGGESEVVESREFQEDEGVVDLYFAGGAAGWRVAAESFDYSCLGARKGLTAAENFARLTEEIRARARGARFDDSYRRVRHLLKFAWPPEERKEAGGLRRLRPGKFRPEAVTVVGNEAQFTRYSRLLRRFVARRITI